MQNVGNATRARAPWGMTLGWALQNGEVDVIASLVTSKEPVARAKMEALIASLPEGFRDKYGDARAACSRSADAGGIVAGQPRSCFARRRRWAADFNTSLDGFTRRANPAIATCLPSRCRRWKQ